jgi:hypothetical protein
MMGGWEERPLPRCRAPLSAGREGLRTLGGMMGGWEEPLPAAVRMNGIKEARVVGMLRMRKCACCYP